MDILEFWIEVFDVFNIKSNNKIMINFDEQQLNLINRTYVGYQNSDP